MKTTLFSTQSLLTYTIFLEISILDLQKVVRIMDDVTSNVLLTTPTLY